MLSKYKNISIVLKPYNDFRLERLKEFLSKISADESIYIYVNCVDVSVNELGIYLDNVCIHERITPVVFINESTTDSILYCKSAQKHCSAKFGLAHDWTFETIQIANNCKISPLISTDRNIVDLLHK